MPSCEGKLLPIKDLPFANNFRWRYVSRPQVGTFGKNIERIRLARGLQVQEIAKIIGATASMVSRWKKEPIVPSGETLARTAERLGVSVDELMRERDLVGHPSTGVLDEAEAFDRDITRGYKRRDIPLIGDAEADSNGFIAWSDEGMVKAQVERWALVKFA